MQSCKGGEDTSCVDAQIPDYNFNVSVDMFITARLKEQLQVNEARPVRAGVHLAPGPSAAEAAATLYQVQSIPDIGAINTAPSTTSALVGSTRCNAAQSRTEGRFGFGRQNERPSVRQKIPIDKISTDFEAVHHSRIARCVTLVRRVLSLI